MAKKVQLPVIGGVRKVIQGTDVAVGTTIAEIGSNTVTLAQLAQLLGNTQSPSSGTIGGGGGGANAALVPGPGLTGGGPLLGAVPLRLIAPSPVFIFGDSAEGDQGIPGSPGVNGIIGINGLPGASVYFTAEDGEDGWPAIPGDQGPQGLTGGAGPPSPAVFFLASDGEEGGIGAPGVQGVPGVTNPYNLSVETHTAAVPAFLANDYFESVTLDTGGTRFSGATAWTWLNQATATATMADGHLITSYTSATGTPAAHILQAPPAGSWTIQADLQPVLGNNVWSLEVYNSATTKSLTWGFQNAGTSGLVCFLLLAGAFSATEFTSIVLSPSSVPLPNSQKIYLQIAFNSGTGVLTFSYSFTGLPGTWIQAGTANFSLIGSAITGIGYIILGTTTGAVGVSDSFIRTA